MDKMLRIDLPQPFLREGRAGAVAQQALPTLPVVPFDAHAGVEREAAAVLAAAHGLTLGLVQQAAPDEEADDPLPESRLQSCLRFRFEARLVKTQAPGILQGRHCIDHNDVKVQVRIHQRAETVDEDDGADARLAIARRQALLQYLWRAERRLQVRRLPSGASITVGPLWIGCSHSPDREVAFGDLTRQNDR